MPILSDAFARTRTQLGGWRSLFLLGGTGLVSLLVHGAVWGIREMIAEWQPYVSAVIGWFAAATVLFLYNVASAPYRLEKAHGDRLANRNSELRDQLDEERRAHAETRAEVQVLKDDRPDLALDIVNVRGSDLTGEVRILMILQICNRGSRPSGTTGWKMEMVVPGFEKFEVPLGFAQGDFDIVSPDGTGFTLDGEQMMPRKAAKPIAAGQIIQGVVIGTPPHRPGLTGRLEGCKLQISFLDVYGRKTIQCVDVMGAEYGGAPPYSPHLDVRWYEREKKANDRP